MFDLPLGRSSAPPTVRQPIFAVGFGNGDGGLLGPAGSALGLETGGADLWAEALVAITVEMGLAPAPDLATLHVANESRAPSIALGETGTIKLGYADSGPFLVFTGQVEGVTQQAQGATRITVANGSAQLTRLRRNQSYENLSAGDIATDLAGGAGVKTGSVEVGLRYPFYAVDDRRSAYQHIASLARKSGYLAYLTTENELNFSPIISGNPVQTFTYGDDVLSLFAIDTAPAVGTVTAIGEGAAGSQGQAAWSWLIKDPSPTTASSGEGEPQRLIQDRSLRSGEAAQRAADGIAAATRRLKITGRLLVPGAPQVTAGSEIAISGARQEALNGPCLVHGLRHSYAKGWGFTSLITFSKSEDSSVGGLGALAGGLL